jgi:hypothetical protein
VLLGAKRTISFDTRLPATTQSTAASPTLIAAPNYGFEVENRSLVNPPKLS